MGEAEAITHINGQARVVIEGVTPEIDGGRFAVKRVPGEEIQVEADIFADGHDVLSAVMLHRHQSEKKLTEVRMVPLVNDMRENVTAFGSEIREISVKLAEIATKTDKFGETDLLMRQLHDLFVGSPSKGRAGEEILKKVATGELSPEDAGKLLLTELKPLPLGLDRPGEASSPGQVLPRCRLPTRSHRRAEL